GGPGIGVVSPRAADLGGALEDAKRADARLFQPNRRTDAGEAGPDDRDRQVVRATRDARGGVGGGGVGLDVQHGGSSRTELDSRSIASDDCKQLITSVKH